MPDADGLFIGGGFPETQMDRLQANERMRSSIRAFLEAGGPAYAECGGLMYLCRGITWQGRRCQMVGVLPAEVKMHQKPQGRGYVRLCETSHHPWGAGEHRVTRAHEFHYSGLEALAPQTRFAYRVERGYGVDGRHDGLVHGNLLANYSHMRNVGSNDWARRFVDFVDSHRSSKQ
jgi:cobyrinic acid a,c-diamide synthase